MKIKRNTKKLCNNSSMQVRSMSKKIERKNSLSKRPDTSTLPSNRRGSNWRQGER
jgi:hypothetical protein